MARIVVVGSVAEDEVFRLPQPLREGGYVAATGRSDICHDTEKGDAPPSQLTSVVDTSVLSESMLVTGVRGSSGRPAETARLRP